MLGMRVRGVVVIVVMVVIMIVSMVVMVVMIVIIRRLQTTHAGTEGITQRAIRHV